MYNGINHLAFITNDMNKTIRFYRDLLGLPLVAGVGNGEFKHYFFQITPSDSIAFFSYSQATPMEIKNHGTPTSAPLGFDHVSIGVNTKADLFQLKDKLEAAGYPVSGAVDHGFGWSIYFFDPNNIPLELTWQVLEIVKPPILADQGPTEVALEGSEPQPGHWPEVTDPTPPEQWVAYPGAGFDIRPKGLEQKRAKVVGE
ncbi:MAG: VOC family protein [SAR324 cluster bacterium]|nr:VOC family protein [SAR324 cluster bacterium]MCZ6533773.1 VOC family protein [SAR324 cluster bacterium]MCZ6557400.1 VOC family protein [SAR324 cluster bacterium]MCZ6626646.1 VOC family protein [SAR324 cluster bacterium]MCZ6647476.1 VOC family protein [SAR324 cluster bacterium]